MKNSNELPFNGGPRPSEVRLPRGLRGFGLIGVGSADATTKTKFLKHAFYLTTSLNLGTSVGEIRIATILSVVDYERIVFNEIKKQLTIFCMVV